MLAPLRSANDRRFSWLRNVFLKPFQDWLNSVQQRQGQGKFTKYAGQKISRRALRNRIVDYDMIFIGI